MYGTAKLRSRIVVNPEEWLIEMLPWSVSSNRFHGPLCDQCVHIHLNSLVARGEVW
jgi:hypothetical protein